MPVVGLLCYVEFQAFDETAMTSTLRQHSSTPSVASSIIKEQTSTQTSTWLESLGKAKLEKSVTKIMQVNGKTAMLVQVGCQHICFFSDHICHLSALESTSTGVVQESVLRHSFYSDAVQKFKIKSRIVACDSAASNLKSERSIAGLRSSAGWSSGVYPCDVHCISRSHTKTFESLMGDTISSITHFSLSLSLGSSMQQLREVMREEISSRLSILEGEVVQAALRYKKTALTFFSSSGAKGLHQAVALMQVLNGDWRDTSTQSWVDSAEQSTVGSEGVASATVFELHVKGATADDVVESNANAAVETGEVNPSALAPVDFAKENARHRREAAAFVAQQPRSFLVILRRVLVPFDILLRDQLFCGSVEFELQQQACLASSLMGSASHHKRDYSVCYAARCEGEKKFFAGLQEILSMSAAEWCLLDSSCLHMRFRCLLFRLVARAGSAVEQLLHHCHKQYPYRLFLALDDDAILHKLVAEPPCRRDSWSQAFINNFADSDLSTMQAALRRHAQGIDTDTSAVECRHAALRRHLQGRGNQTWALQFPLVSCEWMVMRLRTKIHNKMIVVAKKPKKEVCCCAAN
eukprot:2152041-Amphidinium_carterae.2